MKSPLLKKLTFKRVSWWLFGLGCAFFIGGFLIELAVEAGVVSAYLQRKRKAEGEAFVAGETLDKSTFFRFEAKYDYKNKPVTVSAIVNCERFTVSYKNGVKRERVTRLPGLYAMRMDDGAALMVHMPDACQGETTENGKVPTNYLPVAVVYDNAETLAFGTGYFSEDAYENPKSVLKFHGATVSQASALQRQEWERTAPKNLVDPSLWNAPLEEQDEQRVKAALANIDKLSDDELKKLPGYPWRQNSDAFGVCYGVMRLPVPDVAKEYVRSIRPKDGSRYWQPNLYQQSHLYDLIFSSETIPGPLYDGRPFTAYLYGDVEKGLPRRDGSGRIVGADKRFSPEFYPQWTDDGYPWRAPRERGRSDVVRHIDMGEGQNRGFKYCYERLRWDEQPMTLSKGSTASISLNRNLKVNNIIVSYLNQLKPSARNNNSQKINSISYFLKYLYLYTINRNASNMDYIANSIDIDLVLPNDFMPISYFFGLDILPVNTVELLARKINRAQLYDRYIKSFQMNLAVYNIISPEILEPFVEIIDFPNIDDAPSFVLDNDQFFIFWNSTYLSRAKELIK